MLEKDLAVLIDAEADATVPAALKCTCDVWWKPFNQNVLKLLSEKIRDAKKEQKSLKD